VSGMGADSLEAALGGRGAVGTKSWDSAPIHNDIDLYLEDPPDISWPRANSRQRVRACHGPDQPRHGQVALANPRRELRDPSKGQLVFWVAAARKKH